MSESEKCGDLLIPGKPGISCELQPGHQGNHEFKGAKSTYWWDNTRCGVKPHKTQEIKP